MVVKIRPFRYGNKDRSVVLDFVVDESLKSDRFGMEIKTGLLYLTSLLMNR